MNQNRIAKSMKAIIQEHELIVAFEQIFDILFLPDSKRLECLAAAKKEFQHWTGHPEFNGVALVFKIQIFEGEIWASSSPFLSAYKSAAYRNNTCIASWHRFYSEKL